jgi:hypothetical protein
MTVKTSCAKCGTTIKLDFGSLTKEEALDIADRWDREPRECPGQHMELSGLATLWSVKDAIHRLYDLGEGEESGPIETDEAYVSRLLAEGKDVYDGGLNTVPAMNLHSIHDLHDLDHIGFGNFRNANHEFIRQDSPCGARFYLRESRSS